MSIRNKRHQTIHNLLAERGRLSVEELAGVLNVTTMTIRRDLAAMERAGILTRTHGGCVLRSPFVPEAPFSEKDRRQRAQKYAIAREAVRHLTAGDNVYLDTGTTAVHLARVLPGDQRLRVFTNNLRVAMELFGREGVEVVVYGGALASRSPDLVGEVALASINGFRVDVAIMGADALDARRGEFYSADVGTAMLSRSAQQRASKTLVLVDSSKFGKHSLAVVGRLTEDVTLVTDEDMSETDRLLVQSTGAQVVVATLEDRR